MVKFFPSLALGMIMFTIFNYFKGITLASVFVDNLPAKKFIGKARYQYGRRMEKIISCIAKICV